MTLPDGRRVAYEVTGDPAGSPVIVLHGTPGSSRQLAGLGRPARERGLALIVPDRAGYGGSTHDPSKTIASGARDLGEIMAHAGVDACPVGLSGGGRNVPVAHARAITARCPVAQLHVLEGGGHMLLSHLGQIIASVTGQDRLQD